MIIKFLEGCFHHSCKIVEEEETISITPQFKHVPSELIQHIQSLLPAKDAARTCVLSKSWLHAWSTIPTLRFTKCLSCDSLTEKEVIDYTNLIDRTILRYLNNNLSIECFHLHLDIYSWPSLADKWIQALTSGNALKELCLTICCKKIARDDYSIACVTIFGEIDCESLTTISIIVDNSWLYPESPVNVNLLINCSILRVLELVNVCISSEEALNNLICSCSLLERINIILFYQDFKIIKVKNLRCLRELRIELVKTRRSNILEIYDVPSLRVFHYASPEYTFKMNSLGSVRELVLSRKVVDDAFTDMIKSKFPFLESLTLTMFSCKLKTLDITCDTIKRLTLKLCDKEQINIQVHASRLLFFSYDGQEMPSLMFPTNTPEHITLILNFNNSSFIDLSFFLKMREALSLSSNFDIEINDLSVWSLNIDLDDLRRRVMFPTRNVQQLLFKQILIWEHSTLLDLFFSICYPRYVKANYRQLSEDDVYSKKMLRGMMKKKRHAIKDVQIKNLRTENWETLANSWSSIPDEYDGYNSDDQFRLSWCSCKNLKCLVCHLLFHY